MLNKNGQIAPDAAVFQDGKQKAPIVKLKVGDHHEIQVTSLCATRFSRLYSYCNYRTGSFRVGQWAQVTGFNTCSLMHTDANRIITGAHIEITDDFHILANVQEHWSMEGRAIVRETNAKYYSGT